MGKRGPPKKPTYLKLLEGNPGHRRLNPYEPKPDALEAVPEPPAWLNAIAQEEWRSLAPHLVRLRLLTALDLSCFQGYCSAYARWRIAEGLLADSTLTVEGESGAKVRNPLALICEHTMALMLKLLREFGLTPAARASLSISGPEPPDPMEMLLTLPPRRGA